MHRRTIVLTATGLSRLSHFGLIWFIQLQAFGYECQRVLGHKDLCPFAQNSVIMVLPLHGLIEAFSWISPVTSLNWFVNLHKQSHSLKGRFVSHRKKTKALTWKSTCLRQQFCEFATSQWAYVNFGGIVNLCWETQCWILWSWTVILVCGVGDYPMCCLSSWVMMDAWSWDAIQVCGVRDCTMCQLSSQATKQYLKFATSLACSFCEL